MDNLVDANGIMITNSKRCKTCIFKRNQSIITEARLQEIKNYLMGGTNHQCHNTPYLCRGGRELQAKTFYEQGLIYEPTIESLERMIFIYNKR